jgi:hypothetical protein
MNWGYRVAILYAGFASLIGFLVVRSINEDIDLVAPDYYEKELQYDSHKAATERNIALSNPAAIWSDSNGLRLELPKDFDPSQISGTIQLFRPSGKKLDFTVGIDSRQGLIQKVDRSKLVAGMYRVKVEFIYQSESYFLEKQVVVRY